MNAEEKANKFSSLDVEADEELLTALDAATSLQKFVCQQVLYGIEGAFRTDYTDFKRPTGYFRRLK